MYARLDTEKQSFLLEATAAKESSRLVRFQPARSTCAGSLRLSRLGDNAVYLSDLREAVLASQTRPLAE